jgi:hypothetical protein
MSQPYDILQGWGRVILEKVAKLPQEVQETATKRMRHCLTCTMRVNNSCSPSKTGINVNTGKEHKGCGCNLSAKVLADNSKCPLGKW